MSTALFAGIFRRQILWWQCNIQTFKVICISPTLLNRSPLQPRLRSDIAYAWNTQERKSTKWRYLRPESKENIWASKSVMIVTIVQTVLQWQNQGRWDGLNMQRSWKMRKVQTVFYCGTYLADLGVDVKQLIPWSEALKKLSVLQLVKKSPVPKDSFSYFTFMWPCIVTNFFLIKPTDALISQIYFG